MYFNIHERKCCTLCTYNFEVTLAYLTNSMLSRRYQSIRSSMKVESSSRGGMRRSLPWSLAWLLYLYEVSTSYAASRRWNFLDTHRLRHKYSYTHGVGACMHKCIERKQRRARFSRFSSSLVPLFFRVDELRVSDEIKLWFNFFILSPYGFHLCSRPLPTINTLLAQATISLLRSSTEKADDKATMTAHDRLLRQRRGIMA